MEDERKTKKLLMEELQAMRQSVEKLKCIAEEVKQTKINQEKFTKAFLQNSIPTVITTLKEGRIVEVSNAFLILVGLKRDEVVGHTSREIGYITEEHRASFVSELKKSGCIENFEMEIKAKDGGLRYGLFNAVMMNFNNEQYFLTTIQDITKRKKAEEKLRESEGQYRTLVENAMDMVFKTDLNGHFTFINPAGLSAIGYKVEEIIGKQYTILLPADRRDEALRFFGHQLAKGIPNTYSENPVLAKNGQEFWIGQNVQLIVEGNHVSGFQIVARDITERKRAEENLLLANERLSFAQQSARAGIWDWDILTGKLIWSSEFFHLFGLDETQTEASFDAWRKVMHPDDRQIAETVINESISNHKQLFNEYRIILPTGDVRWIVALGNTVYDEQGRAIRMSGICLDETDRKHKEDDLKESEGKYLTLIDKMNEGVIIAQGGVFVLANRRLSEMLSVPAGDLKGRAFIDFVWPEDREMVMRNYRMRIAGEAIDDGYDFRIIGAQGKLTWVFLSATLIMWDGKPATLNLVTDITERKRAEEELAKRESLLNKVFDVLPIGLWFTDKNGTLLRGNPAGVKIWGAEPTVPMEEYGVFKARRLPSGEEIAPDDWALAHTINEGVTVQDELLEIDAFDGQKRVILNYTAPVLDDKGDLLGAIVVNNDITDRKQAEEDREKLHAQLSQAQKMESVGRLAGGVAHDFNNMLGVIIGHTEMALEQVDPAQPLYEDLQEIHKAANRSADLTRQLLAFARKQTISPRVLDLNDTVEGMLKMLQRLIGEDIELSWMPQAALWPVKMDPSQIDQILANLCVNARDAISDLGKVNIKTTTTTFDEDYCAEHVPFVPGDYVMLSVSDDGCGMDKETQTRLFEPFFTTKAMGKGTGLGLATVYGIVKQNNGFINVESELGQGTTFKIYLPRHVGKAEQIQQKGSAKNDAIGHETILLAEDEPTILNMTKMMLEKLGYLVLAAATPGEAIHLANQHSGEIHLLITDVVMPEMNGRDLARKLLSLYPDIRRMFMSGYTADVIAHQGVLDEGVRFIQKPFSMKDLAAKVREALDLH